MRICLLVTLFCVIQSIYAELDIARIEYTLSPIVYAQKPALNVGMKLQGQLPKRLVVNLPHTWDGRDLSEQIKSVKLVTPQAGKFKLKDKYQLEIQGISGTTIELSYQVHQKLGDPSDIHNAIIRSDFIHAPGYSLFALPQGISKQSKLSVGIHWQLLSKTWHALSSHGLGAAYNFKGSVDDLAAAFYIAGKIRLKTFMYHNNPTHISLYGNFDFSDQNIFKMINQIIQSQRDYFHDHYFPYFLVSLVEGTDPYEIGGTALLNSFAAYIHKGLTKLDFYTLFSHEHLHQWIGQKISNEQDEAVLHYWWSEGFTEYLSRVIAFRNGNLSLEAMVAEFNRLLKKYYTSSVIHLENQKISKQFWNNPEVEMLTYRRGFVLALYVEGAMKRFNQSGSLDDVMLKLFQDAQQEQFKFNENWFIYHLRDQVSNKDAEKILDYINKGTTIDLSHVPLPLEKVKCGRNTIWQFKQHLSVHDKDAIKSFFKAKFT